MEFFKWLRTKSGLLNSLLAIVTITFLLAVHPNALAKETEMVASIHSVPENRLAQTEHRPEAPQSDSMQNVTSDPWTFAQQSTYTFAEDSSDSTPFGVYGCQSPIGSSRDLSIECQAFFTILVFGGQEVTVQSTCTFAFKRMPDGAHLLLSQGETCE